MTANGVLTVTGVEWSKLMAQFKVRLVLAVCVTSPFAFAVAMRVQSSVPTDTLFGRTVGESGFAVPLVVLGFAALWVFPVLASIVSGDLFSSEDRYGTWTTVLTRSRSRGELFAGKVLTALTFSSIAVATLGMSSVAAGALVIGRQPLIDLSGVARCAGRRDGAHRARLGVGARADPRGQRSRGARVGGGQEQRRRDRAPGRRRPGDAGLRVRRRPRCRSTVAHDVRLRRVARPVDRAGVLQAAALWHAGERHVSRRVPGGRIRPDSAAGHRAMKRSSRANATNMRSAIAAAAAMTLAACGHSPITSSRIETAIQTTFANLVELQVSRLGLPPMPAPDFAVTAICRKQPSRRPTRAPASGRARWSGRDPIAARCATPTI